MELFRLLGTIAINNDEANKAIDETSGKAEKTESRMSNVFSKVGSAAVKMGAVVASGVAAGSAAIIKIAKDAVESYAEYEQLVGGSQLMFGEAYDFIADRAANAYKNVQMSANDYLQQVNGFSVGLKTALNGDAKAAAELADKIITAEADIVAATGNSQEAVQNAFNGIMKSNFTMLDNLQLGITPTKEGFQEVIDKVNEWNAANGNATSYVIDNLADCQAALVDYVEMQGLAGYAANEGAATISGSIASMKAAWQNLLTGMADENQNLEALFGQFVNSVVTVGDNLIPRIQQMLPRLVDGISQLAEHLAANLPPIVESLLPSVLTGAINIVAEIIKNIPALVKSIIAALKDTIKSYGSTVKQTGAETLQKLIDGLENKLPLILEKAYEITEKLVKGISDKLPDIIRVAGQIMLSLITGIVKSLPSLAARIPSIIDTITTGLLNGMTEVIEIGANLVKGLWNGISNAKDWVLDKVKGFGQDVLDGLKNIFQIHSPSKATESDGKMLALGLAEGIKKNKKYAKKSAEEMAELVLAAAERQMEGLQLYNKISLEGEVDYWNEIRKQFEKGTEERRKADQKYYDARTAVENQRITDAENYLEKEKRIREVSAAEEASYWSQIVEQTRKGTDARIAAEEKYYSALESYKQQYDSYVNNIMNQTSLFEAFALGDGVTGDQLISNLESQIGGLETYYDTMESLQKRIGGTALMEKLQELGADNLAELTAINDMTDEQLQEYVMLYDEKYKLATEKAVEALGEMEGAVKTYTTQMATTTADKFKEIQSAISTRMQAAVTAVKTAVAEMNAALAEAPIGDTVGVTAANVSAHAAGGILTKPTIFGYTPSTNTYHLGGEAGAEAIAPIDVLQGYVRSAVADGMKSGESGKVTSLLEKMVELLQISAGNTTIEINGREFGRMVKEYA